MSWMIMMETSACLVARSCNLYRLTCFYNGVVFLAYLHRTQYVLSYRHEHRHRFERRLKKMMVELWCTKSCRTTMMYLHHHRHRHHHGLLTRRALRRLRCSHCGFLSIAVVVVDDVKAGVDDAVRRSDGGSFSNDDDEMEYELN